MSYIEPALWPDEDRALMTTEWFESGASPGDSA